MTTLLCLGDSITDCGRILQTPPLGNGYVKQLWDQLSPFSPDFQIINKGIDGFTISRLLQNTNSYLALKPEIITILIGINDIGLMMNTCRTSALQEQMMNRFSRDYDQLLEQLYSPHRQIILMEPFVSMACPLPSVDSLCPSNVFHDPGNSAHTTAYLHSPAG